MEELKRARRTLRRDARTRAPPSAPLSRSFRRCFHPSRDSAPRGCTSPAPAPSAALRSTALHRVGQRPPPRNCFPTSAVRRNVPSRSFPARSPWPLSIEPVPPAEGRWARQPRQPVPTRRPAAAPESNLRAALAAATGQALARSASSKPRGGMRWLRRAKAAGSETETEAAVATAASQLRLATWLLRRAHICRGEKML